MRPGEEAAASLGVAAVIAVIALAGVMAVDVGIYAAARARAAAAADAAALAAAPVTFRDFGTVGGPHGEASRFAAANGAELVRCSCPVDPSWAGRTVEVTVSVRVRLLAFGERRVAAVGLAEFVAAAVAAEPQSSMTPSLRSR